VKIWSFVLCLCRRERAPVFVIVHLRHLINAQLCWYFLSAAAASIPMPPHPHLHISPSWRKLKPPSLWSSLCLVLCARAGDKIVKIEFLFELLWPSLALICKLNVWCNYQIDKSMASIDEKGVCGVWECFGWQECFHPIPLGKYPQILYDTLVPN
jgi:hypothetical protein